METSERAETVADDWDPSAADPLIEQARMRRDCPVAWTNGLGTGAWAITKYDDVAAAARDTSTFSSRNEPRLGPVPSPPIEVDHPEHTVYRRLLAPYFGHRRTASMEPVVRALCGQMLQPVLEAGMAAPVDVAERWPCWSCRWPPRSCSPARAGSSWRERSNGPAGSGTASAVCRCG